MWSFTRKLFGDLAVDVLISDRVLQDVTVTTGSNSSSEPSSTGFDQVVLCSVSAIWICLIVLVVIWFCKCNGSEHLNNWTSYLASRASDQQYTSGILRRQAEAADARKVTPEKQRELLRQTWERNQVIMVRMYRPISNVDPSIVIFYALEFAGSRKTEIVTPLLSRPLTHARFWQLMRSHNIFCLTL